MDRSIYFSEKASRAMLPMPHLLSLSAADVKNEITASQYIVRRLIDDCLIYDKDTRSIRADKVSDAAIAGISSLFLYVSPLYRLFFADSHWPRKSAFIFIAFSLRPLQIAREKPADTRKQHTPRRSLPSCNVRHTQCPGDVVLLKLTGHVSNFYITLWYLNSLIIFYW